MNQEFDSLKHKYDELNEKYGEKCRSMEKLYAAKEELRRK